MTLTYGLCDNLTDLEAVWEMFSTAHEAACMRVEAAWFDALTMMMNNNNVAIGRDGDRVVCCLVFHVVDGTAKVIFFYAELDYRTAAIIREMTSLARTLMKARGATAVEMYVDALRADQDSMRATGLTREGPVIRYNRLYWYYHGEIA